ncbi:MAG: hypothetical protein PSX81_00660 [bacterium]|nr:hypothetical protein [bacterium]
MDKVQNNQNDAFKVTATWAKQCIQLKEKYAQLTDSDLSCEAGKEEEMLTRVEARLHKNRKEVMDIIKQSQPATA